MVAGMTRALTALTLLIATPTWAVSLNVTSTAVAESGDVGTMCVSLDSGGQEVAGTQNDLVWDGFCATFLECRVDPASGKELHGRQQNSEDFRYRVLVLSLLDVDPIPDGGLYCCDFQVEAAAGSCCAVEVVNAGGSDPQGNALSLDAGPPARLCVEPTAAGGASGDDDGCQVVAADGASIWPGLGVLAAILAWVAPRCSRSTRRSPTRR